MNLETLSYNAKSVDSANFIQIRLASSEEIKNWSEPMTILISDELSSSEKKTDELPSKAFQFDSSPPQGSSGEVKKPDTLNYRSFRPEKDGLFCERIFGPLNDWMCACGQLKEQRFALDHERALNGSLKIKICPACQVEVTSSRFRRYRMGYIQLACPVTHIWYLNSRPNLFSLLFKLPTKYIKKIIYYKAYTPNLGSPEYLSACLSPGGDFFDHEWEYVHTWLSGKHSSEDIFSPWGQKLRGPKKSEKKFGLWNTFKMPESPNWLENTGALGLLNELQARNWKKEIQKLELELRAGFQFTNDPKNLSSQTFLDDSDEGESRSFGEKFGLGVEHQIIKRRKTLIRRLKFLQSFQKSGFSFSSMIFSCFPVLPPDLRPIIQLGPGQIASSDVNDLYRRILIRNNRLKYYLYETHFVEFLVRSEQQLVQLAVDALLENGKTTQVRHTSGQKRLYKSLTERIGGKQGRFRMNLLGKRVDYSGRSVIVVGPKLHLSQCGLPYEMALELFQVFLLRSLLELHLAKTLRSAKNILLHNKPLARQLLHRILQAHPVLLNRAPTLHRLGIQAFQPILSFGRAIRLHPLVCPAFNADFDGDQMAVHVPLSPQSRIEARLLMLATGNWLASSTGQPNLLPSQDMVLGFYYMTLEKHGYQKGRGNVYSQVFDALQAYQTGNLELHSQIWVKLPDYENQENSQNLRLEFQKPLKKFCVPNDSLSRLSAITKHKEMKKKTEIIRQSLDKERSFQILGKRFERDSQQPIEIRLTENGKLINIYPNFQWNHDTTKTRLISCIRTTPGRVLLNQIFKNYVV